MRILATVVLVAILAAALSADARATTMVASSLEKLVTTSESVVHGTTLSTRTEWDAHRRIVTIATVTRRRVANSIKPDEACEVWLTWEASG